MNLDCHGDFFTVNGQRWYRCFVDSAIVTAVVRGGLCPNCGRRVVGEEQGECTVRSQTFVTIKGLEFEMPSADSASLSDAAEGYGVWIALTDLVGFITGIIVMLLLVWTTGGLL